jgi:hypothetical protein
MKNAMKTRTAISALILVLGPSAYGQAVPAGIASTPRDPFLPPIDGTVHYSLTASELMQFGYYGPGGMTETTALSGNLAYQNKSTVRPFSLLLSGGLLMGNQTGQAGVSTYENVAISQGLVTRTWVFNVADSFSFLPESPTTGLSGVPGVGDLGVIPIQGPAYGPGGGVLSNAGQQIANSLSGSAERQLDHATSFSGSGSYSVLHFLDNNDVSGLDLSQASGTVAVNRRLDARSSASVNAVYSSMSYSSSGSEANSSYPDIETRGLNVSYQRTLSRALSVAGSVGPQWVSSSNSLLIPSALNVAATASLAYTHRYTHASLAYSRGVNSGSGVLPGALSDTISGGVGRAYGRNWVTSATASYVRTSGLTQLQPGISSATKSTYDTTYAGVQVTRRINNPLSAYASYTVQDQSYSSPVGAQNPFSGTSQIIGVGITFTPRSTRLGQF